MKKDYSPTQRTDQKVELITYVTDPKDHRVRLGAKVFIPMIEAALLKAWAKRDQPEWDTLQKLEDILISSKEGAKTVDISNIDLGRIEDIFNWIGALRERAYLMGECVLMGQIADYETGLAPERYRNFIGNSKNEVTENVDFYQEHTW